MDPMSLFMIMLMAAAQSKSTNGLSRAQNNRVPFDSDTNAGYGANKYVDSIFNPSNSIRYTKSISTSNGATIAGADNKNLSIDSVLAFAEMGLKSTDGKNGNGNGEVSLTEFKNGLNPSASSEKKTAIANAIDTDGDKIISRKELASYYLLADKLDGNFNGNITKSGIDEFNNLAIGDDTDLKAQLEAMQAKIDSTDAGFKLESPKVDGINEDSSYQGDDAATKGANAGETARSLLGTDQQLYTDVQFLYGDTDEEKTESGLAFATSLLGGQKKVPVSSCNLNAPDIDNDGYISADEVLATAMYQDKNKDGVIDYTERLKFNKLVKDGDFEIDNVKEIWEDKDLKDQRIDFEMPEKTESSSSSSSSNELIDLFKLIFQTMFNIEL